MAQGQPCCVEKSSSTSTTFMHHVIRWIRLSPSSTKYFIACLVLLAMVYIPAYHQLAQPQGRDEELEGWPKNGTRDVRLFIQPDNITALISPNEVCDGHQPFLLVIVCSAVQNTEARKAIRDTWASRSHLVAKSNKLAAVNVTKDVYVLFLMGVPDNSSLSAIIEEESKSYGDIIQEGFIDSYNNLTLKSVMLLKWVNQRCSSAMYVMKTDDDTMVNLNALQAYLRSHQASVARSKIRPFLLVGYLICGARPISDSTHKWYMPRYIFSERTYPNYLSGSGYVMSQEVVQSLYRAALKLPLIPLEDVYITGQCAHYSRIRPIGYYGFSLAKRPMTACALGHPQVITTHRLSPKELKEAWELSHAPTNHCNKTSPSAAPPAAVSSFLRGAMFGRRRNSFSSRRNANALGCF